MPRQWTEEASSAFWASRCSQIIVRYPHLEDERQRHFQNIETRNNRTLTEREKFFTDNNLEPGTEELAEPNARTKTISNLCFWIENSSWTFCAECNLLERQKLPYTFQNKPINKHTKKCICSERRYIVPRAALIPDVLQNLTWSEVRTLRPFDLHGCEYQRLQHGYRVKSGMLRLTWSDVSPEFKIQHLTDPESRVKCNLAYTFLLNSQDSDYNKFLNMRETSLAENKKIFIFDFKQTQGIECALWPNLYPVKGWCESTLEGNTSRQSNKISFEAKVFSEILDYAMTFELLHFHYDRWIFKTITGAINSAKRMKCSPARALDTKTFSPNYWKWQHRFLLDAVDQFGFPSLFITLSPYEWSFPTIAWLKSATEATGRGPTMLAPLETVHIAHVLEQLVRGYICGTSDKRWTQHIMSYNRLKGVSNVNTFFYRFEFQKRGTVHLHLLVWLKNITQINHQLLRADIPWEDSDKAFLVQKLQKSNKSCMRQNENPTQFTEENGRNILKLKHPADAFALNLRGYISTVLPLLQCSMDVQTTDGKNMILKYVTSYVAKWKDSFQDDSMYSLHVSPFQAALRHLRECQPSEPEMCMQMQAIKIAWSSSRTKKFVCPSSEGTTVNQAYVKYKQRAKEDEGMNVLQWLRAYNERPSKPARYKSGTTLVGLKMASPLSDEHFFQFLLTRFPHRCTSELYHPRHSEIPHNIRFFASAMTLMPQVWNDPTKVKAFFERQGHKDYYIATLIHYVSSMQDTFQMWRLSLLPSNAIKIIPNATTRFPTDPMQSGIVQHIKAALRKRDDHYRSMECMDDQGQYDQDEELDMDDINQEEAAPSESPVLEFQDVDWRKFILVLGKPGTGKTQTMLCCIEHCISVQLKVLVATPTGYLASRYRCHFDDRVMCDTIHGIFQYPVSPEDRPTINWSLSQFDFIVIDEVSMIPERIFQHIITTINTITARPIVMASGDQAQQQPISTVNGKTVQVQSILQSANFPRIIYKYTLVRQHRCDDPKYMAFLHHLRFWKPSQHLLDDIQRDRVICKHGNPTDSDILSAIMNHPEATFLTVSRAACGRINNIVLSNIFKHEQPLLTANCDDDFPPISLFKNMKVVFTQNRDKKNNVVNGQRASIIMVEKNTVFLKLSDKSVVSTHPVTSLTQSGQRRTVYPFSPAYAITICKAQGQTLGETVLWFDGNIVPQGSGYVAVSRVKRLQDLHLLTPMQPKHFSPFLS